MKRIKELREQMNMSQADLAKRIGVSQVCLSRYETGERRPSYTVLKAIARVFDCSLDYLLSEADA